MTRRKTLSAAVGSDDSTAALRTLRDMLAVQLEAHTRGHADGCSCTCGPPPGNASAINVLTGRLQSVLKQLDAQTVPPPAAAPVEQAPAEKPKRTARDLRREQQQRWGA